jgi:hypothetical protein
MTSDLTDESALFVEIHSLKVMLVGGEDLIGFWDYPNLVVTLKVNRPV